MHNFRSFLNELSCKTGIKFNLHYENGTCIYEGYEEKENSEKEYVSIFLGNGKATIDIDKKYKQCISLLKYTIENKYRELYSKREQSLIDILEGKEVSIDNIYKSIPFLSKSCRLMLVTVDGSKYEALNVIRQIYSEEQVMSFIYNESIVVIGNFEDIEEHANSIKDSITGDLYCKCFVSFGNTVNDIKDIKKEYTNARECIMLVKKFNIKEDILDYNKLLFEKVVYNINPLFKEELLYKFRERFNLFDSEMINTVEQFVKCGLNVSDASRRLYIHRNTLIYRLEKIKKETGFDIRNFKEATVFIIAFLVWKENK